MRLRLYLTVFAAVAALATGPAGACSMVPGYKVPTTLELAAQADSIILARVGDVVPGKEEHDGRLTMHPETLVVGEVLPATFTMDGNHSSARWPAQPSDPNELHHANPDAFAGGCNRYVFDRGMLLLLFMARDAQGDWQVVSNAFARTLEDVPNADALWVRAVRYYASVVALPERERRSAMRSERDRLLATGIAEDALLAADIARQLSGRRTQNFD